MLTHSAIHVMKKKNVIHQTRPPFPLFCDLVMMLMCPLLALSVVDRGQRGKTDSSEGMQPHTQQTDANKQYTQYSDTFLSETA